MTEREVHNISEAPEWVLEMIKQSKMNPTHDHLNKLLDDEENKGDDDET